MDSVRSSLCTSIVIAWINNSGPFLLGLRGKQGHYNLLWYDYIFSDLQFFSLCLVKFQPWKFSSSPPNSHVSFMCLPNKNVLYQLSDPPKQPGVTYSCSEANNKNNPRNSKSRKKKRKITEVNIVCIKSLLSASSFCFIYHCRSTSYMYTTTTAEITLRGKSEINWTVSKVFLKHENLYTVSFPIDVFLPHFSRVCFFCVQQDCTKPKGWLTKVKDVGIRRKKKA